MANEDTSLGIPLNLACLAAYFMGFLSGGVILILEKDNKLLRFHAMQSTITSIIFCVASTVITTIFGFIPFLGALIGLFIMIPIGFAGLGLWIFLMYKGFQCEKFKLPIIGDIAESKS